MPLLSYSNARLSALSDGVFAIVLTLLALEVRMPQGDGQSFAEAFAENLGVLEEYFLAFLLVGVLWKLQHGVLDVVTVGTPLFLWLNLLFLATVTITPWSLSALIDFGGEPLAVVFFSGMLLTGWLLLLAMTLCARLADLAEGDRARLRGLRHVFAGGSGVAALSVLLAPVAAGLAVWVWVLLVPLLLAMR